MREPREQKTYNLFLNDTAEHEIQIMHDNGVYRHVRFRNPESWAYGVDVAHRT